MDLLKLNVTDLPLQKLKIKRNFKHKLKKPHYIQKNRHITLDFSSEIV